MMPRCCGIFFSSLRRTPTTDAWFASARRPPSASGRRGAARHGTGTTHHPTEQCVVTDTWDCVVRRRVRRRRVTRVVTRDDGSLELVVVGQLAVAPVLAEIDRLLDDRHRDDVRLVDQVGRLLRRRTPRAAAAAAAAAAVLGLRGEPGRARFIWFLFRLVGSSFCFSLSLFRVLYISVRFGLGWVGVAAPDREPFFLKSDDSIHFIHSVAVICQSLAMRRATSRFVTCDR